MSSRGNSKNDMRARETLGFRESEDGRALGGIPGWRMLIDPDYADFDRIENRVDLKRSLTPAAVWDEKNFSEFANGMPAFAVTSVFKRLPGTVDFNPKTWSIVLVASWEPSGAAGATDLLLPDNASESSGFGPRLTINVLGELAVYNSDASVKRICLRDAFVDARAHFFIITFSTREGLKIFRDAELVAQNPNDKNKLNEKFLAGQYRFLNAKSGANSILKVGLYGVLDIDLGRSQHVGYRKRLESFVANKYGISMLSPR